MDHRLVVCRRRTLEPWDKMNHNSKSEIKDEYFEQFWKYTNKYGDLKYIITRRDVKSALYLRLKKRKAFSLNLKENFLNFFLSENVA